MSCAPYVAISIDEDENDPKTANEIMAMPSRRGIWEAWQDWTWSLEVLSLILATASTITVCIILGRWNNQPLQAWPFPIQPNSLISVFSTLAKTALMLPMASVISQMKWIWFEKPRNLAQLQVFDRASRGPWGALNLLWDTRGKAWITKAACVLSVAAMTFEPTAQQVLSFEPRETQIKNATASLSVARNWTSELFTSNMYASTLHIPLHISVCHQLIQDILGRLEMQSQLFGVFKAHAEILEPKSTCTASVCSWENVETLGACSICSTVPRVASSSVHAEGDSFKLSPPPNATLGLPITGEDPFPDVYCDLSRSIFEMTALPPDHLMNATWFLKLAAVDLIHIGRWAGNNTLAWGNQTVNYTMCQIHPCLQTFESVSVRNGVYSYGRRTDKWLTLVDNDVKNNPSFALYTDGATSTSTWPIEKRTARGTRDILAEFFTAAIFRDGRYAEQGILASVVSWVAQHGTSEIMDNISNVLSAIMRSEDNLDLQFVSGTASGPQTFIIVNWVWMVGPLVLLTATAATLAIAMLQNAPSRHRLAYKDSSVALLGLGFRDQAGPAGSLVGGNPFRMGPRYTAYEAEIAASKLRAKLERDANGDYMFIKC